MTQPALVVLALCAFSRVGVGAESPAASRGTAAANRLVVWDGEQAAKGAGWSNPKGSTVGPQTVEAHSGKSALEFRFKGGGEEWPGTGWNWCAFQTGACGTDITSFKNFTFWMKAKGKIADVQLNLLCNGEKFDMPEHHTEKVSALTYCPQLLDGAWHQVSIPLADLKQPAGFDPRHVGELQIFNAGDGDGSFFIDDIAFDSGEGDRQTAAAPGEMLLNGNFADGTNHWVIVAESGTTGRAEVVREGPAGQSALRLKVLTVGDQPWRFQFFQPGLRVARGKTYVLTFWAKSNEEGDFTVNCQQNHEPWDHPTLEEMPLATEWKQLRFTFVAAWDDDQVRITFTNLGTAPGRTYWFANCSLVPPPDPKQTAALTPR